MRRKRSRLTPGVPELPPRRLTYFRPEDWAESTDREPVPMQPGQTESRESAARRAAILNGWSRFRRARHEWAAARGLRLFPDVAASYSHGPRADGEYRLSELDVTSPGPTGDVPAEAPADDEQPSSPADDAGEAPTGPENGSESPSAADERQSEPPSDGGYYWYEAPDSSYVYIGPPGRKPGRARKHVPDRSPQG